MKKYILPILITAIVFTGIGVFATIEYQADEIGYGTGTIKDAIDDLYDKADECSVGGSNEDVVIPFVRLAGQYNYLDTVFYYPLKGYHYLDVTYSRGDDCKMGIFRGTPVSNIGNQLAHTFTSNESFTDFDISEYQDAYFYLESYPKSGRGYCELKDVTLHN